MSAYTLITDGGSRQPLDAGHPLIGYIMERATIRTMREGRETYRLGSSLLVVEG